MSAPEFSPLMLRFFLQARASLVDVDRADLKTYKRNLRKAARVTVREFELAWSGRLTTPEPRARLWAVLGFIPADYGVLLTVRGQEP